MSTLTIYIVLACCVQFLLTAGIHYSWLLTATRSIWHAGSMLGTIGASFLLMLGLKKLGTMWFPGEALSSLFGVLAIALAAGLLVGLVAGAVMSGREIK
jgi:hypothetical protein